MAAQTPNMDKFYRHYPVAALAASGIEVGLPWGEKGNSETGHRNIGAGRVQYQPLPGIDATIANRSFFKNEALLGAIQHAKKNKSNLHIMGLASQGGVHSHINHLYALLQMAKEQRFRHNVFLHIFTDGRDTAPQAAIQDIKDLENQIGKFGVGTIASVTGRFYAMDRNENWERTKQTYDMLTGGPRGTGASSARTAVENCYHQKIFDEMIPPTAITRGGGPITAIKDNDAIIFFNFRPDRARQLTRAFVQNNFTGFDRQQLNNIYFAGMDLYDPLVPIAAAFQDKEITNPMADVISRAGLKQLHVAETEKYAHITYYLNGGREKPFPGEDNLLIKSSGAQNFASEPHMNGAAITDAIIKEIARGFYQVIFVNFANPDMVGHTGDFKATVEACSFVDICLGRVQQALPPSGALLVTADHGNAEEKINPLNGARETDHTSNPVPFCYAREALRRTTPRSEDELVKLFSTPIGMLADVAPTVLDILHLEKPSEMTGISLLASLA